MSKTKVIIVADENIHSFLAQEYPHWDAQVPAENVDIMWQKLEDGSLSTESSIVIISDENFDNKGTLETALATLAPEACVIVISYDPSSRNVIEQKVEDVRVAENIAPGPIHFIDPNEALNEIDEVTAAYFGGAQSPVQAVAAPATPHVVSDALEKKTVAEDNSGVDTSRNGMVITSTSSKGGSGKTTVGILTGSTIALSSQKAFEQGLVDRPLDVVVVDMDTRDGQIGFLIGQTAPTSLNIRVSPDWSAKTIKNNLVYDSRLGVHALLAPKRGRTADDTGPDFYRHIIRTLKTMFDVVIIDTSVNYLDELIETVCFPEADAILFVTNLGVGSVFGMARWFEETTGDPRDGGMGIPSSKIGVVANQSLANVGMDKVKLTEAAMGATLLVAIPLDTAAVVAASNHNRLADIIKEHPSIAPAYFRLAKKIMRDTKLVPLFEENSSTPTPAVRAPAPAPSVSPAAPKKSSFFRRGNR